MTRDEADSAQDWASLGGGEAFALIERHADDNQEAHEMMEAWKRAHVKAEREACAVAAWAAGMGFHNREYGTKCDAREVGSAAAEAIRARARL